MNDVLWLSASPSLQYFDRPLQQLLAQDATVANWQYFQGLDEGSSLDQAVTLLHKYLSECDRPVHLIGHGISGAIGWLYAQQHPDRVQSLVLLSVAAQPMLTWHHYYYLRRLTLPYSREQILAQMVHQMFGKRLPHPCQTFVKALQRDLDQAPHQQSLFRRGQIKEQRLSCPLLVCNSEADIMVPSTELQEWQQWLKPNDVLWTRPAGGHFFHFSAPHPVQQAIAAFWDGLRSTSRTADQQLITEAQHLPSKGRR